MRTSIECAYLQYYMRRITTVLLTIFVFATCMAEEHVTLSTPTGEIHGRLLLPAGGTPCPVVLIIAGSGPTDMNGNTIGSGYSNNSLKMLAEELANNGIASVRYDKRGIGESRVAGTKEEELRFEHYIVDAAAWADMLGADNRFSKVVIAGHSEGSLIGMVASRNSKAVKAYISIAGCGRPAHEVIEEQLKNQPEQIQREATAINKELREGRTVDDTPHYLAPLYRKSVQPYLISWFRYNPSEEIAKLTIPVLIIQGDMDIQVSVAEAERLHMARLLSSYRIIPGMNHVLKHCESLDMITQMETYRNPSLPVKDELIGVITRFMGK